jgi:antirestriction protein ArdC
VFNAEQIDGLNLNDDVPTTNMQPLEAQNFIIDRYIKSLESKGLSAPEISYTYVGEYGNHFSGDSSPNWSPQRDIVTLPRESQFNSPEEWFETLMHELVHSTGHINRLDRTDITNNYASDRSARGLEELIAEMGAATLGEMFGINYDVENMQAYIEGWQKAISETDLNSLQVASNKAQQAVDYLLGIDLGDWSPIEGYSVRKTSTSSKEEE